MPPTPGAPGLEVGPEARPKKDKERRKGTKSSGASAGEARKGKGHPKKVKATKRLAAELQGLGGALVQLRSRLTDLHSVQLDHAESNAALARRVEALDGRSASERERGERLARRLDQLAATVEGLASRIDQGVPPHPMLEGLAVRVARAESALTVLQDQPDPAETADRVLGEVEGRMAALRVILDAQAGRLERLEQDVRVPPHTPDPSVERPWRLPLEALSRDLDGRIQALNQGLTSEVRRGRQEARQGDEGIRSWTQERLAHLHRRHARALGLAAVLVGVVAAALVAVGWWGTDRLLAASTDRLRALEQRFTLAPEAEPAVAPWVSQDILERMRHLESGALEGSRELAATRQVAEGVRGQLAMLSDGQQDLVERLERLRQDLSTADKGLAVLGERVSGLTPGSPVPRDKASAEGPSDPSVLAGPGYAIQLVAYHGRAPIGPFVERFGIGDRARISEIRIAGRPAYAVLLGPYGSESEAREAIGALSPGLRSLEPWVRRLPAGARLQPWN
ncbi:MAG: SPOR domain-containing protein [Bdellovibrio bacteriovorus]